MDFVAGFRGVAQVRTRASTASCDELVADGGADPDAGIPALARATVRLDHLEPVDQRLALARGDLAERAVRADAPRSWSSAKHRRQRARERLGAIGDQEHAPHGDLEDRHWPEATRRARVPGAPSG